MDNLTKIILRVVGMGNLLGLFIAPTEHVQCLVYSSYLHIVFFLTGIIIFASNYYDLVILRRENTSRRQWPITTLICRSSRLLPAVYQIYYLNLIGAIVWFCSDWQYTNYICSIGFSALVLTF